MIRGMGIDMVEVSRIQAAIGRPRFLARVFTSGEQRACLGRSGAVRSLAARFSAKEATMKALGTGWGPVSFLDIEVVSEPGRPPLLLLHGAARARAEDLGVRRAHLSLSHTAEHALACVILEGEERRGEGCP